MQFMSGEPWLGLLDLGPLRRLDVIWGDMGRLAYWFPQADLEGRTFGNVLGILSSH